MLLKKRVYICSPYRGEIEKNKAIAKAMCSMAIASGCAPYAPHLYLPDILDDNDPKSRDAGIRVGLKFMAICDEVWIYTPDGISEGMQREINLASDFSIPAVKINDPVRVRRYFQ